MIVIIYAIFSLWSLRLLTNILAYAHLWFVKEYRWDRMFIHLRTTQGKKILFMPFRRPPISPKSVALVFGSLITITLFLVFLPLPLFFRFLASDLLLFPLTFLLIGILRLPTLAWHAYKIGQAIKKLKIHESMVVIGITGSFGKTSTKEYLTTILTGKFKVLKTQASQNSAIGIAEVVLPKLTPGHEVFIVEMGAYKRGEIAAMTEMVKPEIGIITAINPQHQDLFGTIETTMKAKYELIAGLVGKRIGIFNADNPYVRQMAQRAINDGVVVWSVGRQSQSVVGAQQYFTFTKPTGDLKGISFLLSFGKESLRVKVPVLGEHQATNVSLAIAGSVAAGLPFGEAVKRVSLVESVAKNMQPKAGINGALFIDDTFNNNPDAAIAALDFISKTKGRKILVFQPMIELGSFTKISHERVGQRAAEVCDDIILTNNNFLEYFEKGVKKVSPGKSVKVMSPDQAARHIKETVKSGDTVLFKGKEAEQVLKRLIH